MMPAEPEFRDPPGPPGLGSLIAAVAAFASGCASYALGPDPATSPSRSEETPSVGVETVAVRSDRGADAGRLTRHLVRRLRALGLDRAHWTGDDPSSASVACSVRGVAPRTLAGRLYARARVVCTVADRAGRAQRLTGDGDASMGYSPAGRSAPLRTASEVYESAAIEAIETAAPAIAEAVTGTDAPDD